MKYEARGLAADQAEAEVVRLWDQRGAGANDALFRWGYLKSPVGPGHCFLLHAVAPDTSSVVGAVGVGIRRVDVGGETLSAGLLGDFFVVKAHRTFFPALSLQRAVLAWARKQFDLVYGFPNESAKPLIKKLGFRDLARLERHVLVLRHGRYIGSRIGSKVAGRVLAMPLDVLRQFVHPRISRRARSGLAFRKLDRFDERFDRLFRARAFGNLTVGHRDAKLLQWRFLERPDQPCSMYGIIERASGDVRAYVVIHVAKDMAHVRDLLGVDVDAMAEALLLVAGEARRQGCAAISFICAAPTELKEKLERLGFRVRDDEQGPRTLYGHAGDGVSQESVLSTLQHWYATEADEDQ